MEHIMWQCDAVTAVDVSVVSNLRVYSMQNNLRLYIYISSHETRDTGTRLREFDWVGSRRAHVR